MGAFLVYRASTGKIVRWGQCQDGLETDQANVGEVGIVDTVGVSGDTHYVVLGPPAVISEKPMMSAVIDKTRIAVDGVDEVVISNIPVGTAAVVESLFQTINDGSIEFSSDQTGIATISLSHSQYYPQEFKIEVGLVLVGLVETLSESLSLGRTPSLVESFVEGLAPLPVLLFETDLVETINESLPLLSTLFYEVGFSEVLGGVFPLSKSYTVNIPETFAVNLSVDGRRVGPLGLPETVAETLALS